MEFEKLIAERYSVRKFENKQLEQEKIDSILSSASLAPTGCNNQPQRILVLNNAEATEKLKECTKCHFDAPCAMLVCFNRDESWVRKYDGALSAPTDAAIVSTYIMLAAHNLGLGCCFVMHFDPEKMRKSFNIPESFVPAALLVMGYPAKDAAPLDGHFKFKPLGDIVSYDTF